MMGIPNLSGSPYDPMRGIFGSLANTLAILAMKSRPVCRGCIAWTSLMLEIVSSLILGL